MRMRREEQRADPLSRRLWQPKRHPFLDVKKKILEEIPQSFSSLTSGHLHIH